eukprot:793181-Rhodomonas_salina.1
MEYGAMECPVLRQRVVLSPPEISSMECREVYTLAKACYKLLEHAATSHTARYGPPYTMSGTSIPYMLTIIAYMPRGIAHTATRVLCDVRLCSYHQQKALLRACYAMSGTDLAYAAIYYAMSGTDLAYAAMPVQQKGSDTSRGTHATPPTCP